LNSFSHEQILLISSQKSIQYNHCQELPGDRLMTSAYLRLCKWYRKAAVLEIMQRVIQVIDQVWVVYEAEEPRPDLHIVS